MKYSYQIYRPSGNDTALVLPLEQDTEKRRLVARQIMKLHPQVEQVGFVNSKVPHLFMAGGEFCGNAFVLCGCSRDDGKIKSIASFLEKSFDC